MSAWVERANHRTKGRPFLSGAETVGGRGKYGGEVKKKDNTRLPDICKTLRKIARGFLAAFILLVVIGIVVLAIRILIAIVLESIKSMAAPNS